MPTQRRNVEPDILDGEDGDDLLDPFGDEFKPPEAVEAADQSFMDGDLDLDEAEAAPETSLYQDLLDQVTSGTSRYLARTGVSLPGPDSLIADTGDNAMPDIEIDQMHLADLAQGVQEAMAAGMQGLGQEQMPLTPEDPFATLEQGAPSPLADDLTGSPEPPGDLGPLGDLG